ncbi:MAG: hypothetical protein HYR55_01410 [Acidobacteria bacterium]|nr:hypothetical protein [Acidobacteriota bacterium]MBI3656017.1 hypothetical protein [Acidobacteriota bacterium]
MKTPPRLTGNIEFVQDKDRIIIAGDPEGLRSFAEMLNWLANVDQGSIKNMPDGEREHIHLSPGTHISYNSRETEICRLDSRGTGDFPESYKSV